MLLGAGGWGVGELHFMLGEKAVIAATVERGLGALGWSSWSMQHQLGGMGRGGKPRSGTLKWLGDPWSRKGLNEGTGGVKGKPRLRCIPQSSLGLGPHVASTMWSPWRSREKGCHEGSLAVSAGISNAKLKRFLTISELETRRAPSMHAVVCVSHIQEHISTQGSQRARQSKQMPNN